MDFIEECKSHILFIPGIFIEDCLDEVRPSEKGIDFSTVPSEDIDDIPSGSEDLDNLSEDDLQDATQGEKGLELNDLLNDINNPIGCSSDLKSSNIKYDIVPKYFVDLKSWIKSTNLLCCYCHGSILKPMPIAIGQNKILIPENEENSETFVAIADKKNKKNSENDTFEYNDKMSDDHLLFSCQTFKEVKSYKIHNILCCDIVCVGNYIRKVEDSKIINKRESIRMSISIYKELTGVEIEDIPEKDLWIVMEQYCGNTGQKREEYIKKNFNKEIKLKQAMKIIY